MILVPAAVKPYTGLSSIVVWSAKNWKPHTSGMAK
jgi:hypothetical protein